MWVWLRHRSMTVLRGRVQHVDILENHLLENLVGVLERMAVRVHVCVCVCVCVCECV